MRLPPLDPSQRAAIPILNTYRKASMLHHKLWSTTNPTPPVGSKARPFDVIGAKGTVVYVGHKTDVEQAVDRERVEPIELEHPMLSYHQDGRIVLHLPSAITSIVGLNFISFLLTGRRGQFILLRREPIIITPRGAFYLRRAKKHTLEVDHHTDPNSNPKPTKGPLAIYLANPLTYQRYKGKIDIERATTTKLAPKTKPKKRSNHLPLLPTYSYASVREERALVDDDGEKVLDPNGFRDVLIGRTPTGEIAITFRTLRNGKNQPEPATHERTPLLLYHLNDTMTLCLPLYPSHMALRALARILTGDPEAFKLKKDPKTYTYEVYTQHDLHLRRNRKHKLITVQHNNKWYVTLKNPRAGYTLKRAHDRLMTQLEANEQIKKKYNVELDGL